MRPEFKYFKFLYQAKLEASFVGNAVRHIIDLVCPCGRSMDTTRKHSEPCFGNRDGSSGTLAGY
jgi:hypothetical protein